MDSGGREVPAIGIRLSGMRILKRPPVGRVLAEVLLYDLKRDITA
ncbi:MAG: hypothetical protein NTV93_18540 [Verrucomicrobia bacterium]|nr:hypothetical protein [Verrucomicrobiota bacterium]